MDKMTGHPHSKLKPTLQNRDHFSFEAVPHPK
jgi:hypothetical protein